MKTAVIKSPTRKKLESESLKAYSKIENTSVVTNVSMFFDTHDEKHTLVISYHQ